MRTRFLRFFFFCLATLFATTLLVLAGTASSATDELDVDLMQSIEDSNKSMASNIAIKEAAGATADARALHEMFGKVEGFYRQKGDAPDAIELSSKSRALAQQIEQLITAKDFEAATDAATTLSRTCKTCHNFYKKS
jgi:hypothetical protein